MPKTVSRKPASRKSTSGKAAVEPDPARTGKASARDAAENAPGSASEAGAKAARKGPGKTPGKASAKISAKTSTKKGRLPPRKTFLVAATRIAADGTTMLDVYAAVTRSPAEALAAARAELGPDVAVELTGKLSNRMAKTLGLKPGALHPI